MRHRILLTSLLALGLTGCGDTANAPTADSSRLTLDRNQATPGDVVIVRVSAGPGEELTYGACPVLQVRREGGWEAPDSEPRACIEIAYVTAAGETGGPLEVRVPDSAEPGQYRISHQVNAARGRGSPEAIELTAPLRISGE